MIRRLIVLKGHPTFEMIVERLVGIHFSLFALSNLIFFAIVVASGVVCVVAVAIVVAVVAAALAPSASDVAHVVAF